MPYLVSPVQFTTFSYPYLDEWTLSCFALVDWVQRCCTELFHAFSLDYFHGSFTHTTGRLRHVTVQGNCFSRQWVRKLETIWNQKTNKQKTKTNYTLGIPTQDLLPSVTPYLRVEPYTPSNPTQDFLLFVKTSYALGIPIQDLLSPVKHPTPRISPHKISFHL